ncbi:FeoB-associated Cys-rich membrane protein [Vibrio sp. JC009]|nr:FeoB-associated Cys-rich membrane protein [Vibrio sp. JC009]WED24272.1 FeoB-associated Cys-rich membrane protein [Vibrio sp. JC009]
MYEQSIDIWDIIITLAVVFAAAVYVYRKLFRKKSGCASGSCDSCPSAKK